MWRLVLDGVEEGKVAEHGKNQKVTDAIKGRSKTSGLQKISRWMSSARPLRHV